MKNFKKWIVVGLVVLVVISFLKRKRKPLAVLGGQPFSAKIAPFGASVGASGPSQPKEASGK